VKLLIFQHLRVVNFFQEFSDTLNLVLLGLFIFILFNFGQLHTFVQISRYLYLQEYGVPYILLYHRLIMTYDKHQSIDYKNKHTKIK